MSENSKLIRIRAAAKEIGVSDQLLRKWVDSGIMSCVKLPSGERRFERAEIDRMYDVMRINKVQEQLSTEIDELKGDNEPDIMEIEKILVIVRKNVEKLQQLGWNRMDAEIHIVDKAIELLDKRLGEPDENDTISR
jgi:predicted site-specific integrase-resolvase